MIPKRFPKDDKEASLIIKPIRQYMNKEIKEFMSINGVKSQQDLLDYKRFIVDNSDSAISALKERVAEIKDRKKSDGKKR